jgi:hypothetical protein
LGLKGEDKCDKHEKERRTCGVGPSNGANVCDDSSAAIPIFQHLPGQRVMFDRNNPVMKPGSLYPNMKEFMLTMRQYAIDKEFELGDEATDRMRYRGYCRGGDCPWSINARLEHKGWNVVVVSVLNDVHYCISSNRRRTSTPTAVGSKEITEKVARQVQCCHWVRHGMEGERESYGRVVWHLGGKFPTIVEVERSCDGNFTR